MMNILFCYQNGFYPQNGGVQRYCYDLSNYLKSHGYTVFFLSLVHDEDFQKIVSENYYHLPEKLRLDTTQNKEFYFRLISELKIDTIVNNEATNKRFDFFNNTKNLRVNKLSIFHSNPVFNLKLNDKPNHLFSKIRFFLINYLKKNKRKKMINNLVSKSDKVIFLSERYVSALKVSLSISSKKITSISNFIEINSNLGYCKKENTILFVGRLDEVKQLDVLLLAWGKIVDEFENWTLNILGTGPNEKIYKNLVKTKLIKGVKFIGKTDPIPYYQKSKIICLPSKYEGFGLVLTEAMSFGVVPVAFNNWLSLQDIIDDGVNGIIVNDKSIIGLTNSLRILMFNEDNLNKMSKNSFKKAKYFDIHKIGKDWLKLLNSL